MAVQDSSYVGGYVQRWEGVVAVTALGVGRGRHLATTTHSVESDPMKEVPVGTRATAPKTPP